MPFRYGFSLTCNRPTVFQLLKMQYLSLNVFMV